MSMTSAIGNCGAARYGPILWVATTGNDTTGTGSSTAPYATIQKASTVATAGTTVLVRPGTYSNVYMMASTGGGTTGAPVRYVSVVPWGAKIESTGTDNAWYIGDQGTNHADHIRIIGFEITAPSAKSGILVDASDVWVVGCHVHDVGNNNDTDGGGITLEGYYSGGYTGTGNAAIGNWIHHIGRSTNTLRHCIYVASPNGYVASNVCYDTGGWGIHMYHGPNGGVVVNNTVFACTGQGGIVFGDGPEIATTSGFVGNNIVRGCTKGLAEVGSGIAGVTWTNNALYNNGTNTDFWTGSHVNGVTSEPLMVNYQSDGTGDYRLTGSSPCLGAGTTTNAPVVDYDNVGHRPTPSIGAFR